jgi:hypothetical protein
MNQTYVDTVRLLLDIAPAVFESGRFAIKGGTALNLFVQDMPRLSVDIDVVAGVNYLDRRVASRRNVTRRVVVVQSFLFNSFVEGCGHVGEGCGGGQRSRAAARCPRSRPVRRRRIVHMSIACRARSARPSSAAKFFRCCFTLLPASRRPCAGGPGSFLSLALRARP